MTELEHVEIEGFKGLEYVEFEPTDINLITGRNNTGKTSFLEAVDLLFNPANLVNFGENLDSVIHADSERSMLRGKSSETELKYSIQKPSLNEAEKYLSEVTPVISGHRVHRPNFIEEDSDESNEFDSIEELLERVGEVVDGVFERLMIDKYRKFDDDLLVLSTTTDKYPCFLGMNESTAILKKVLDEVKQEIEQETEIESTEIYDRNNGPIGRIRFNSRLIEISFPSRNSFLREPENTNSATFIESINLTENIKQDDDEQEPVKVDDINDFMKEKDIVNDLKTFDLNNLIFEGENGEKEQIPFDFMGDGFKSIVGLLWELMDDDVENEIVLLEEPETHMHPGYVREVVYFLIELAREEDVQLFITTHDGDFINDFFTENLTDEEESYLEDEFSLLRMEEDDAVVEDYETARENLKDLHLDLRGI